MSIGDTKVAKVAKVAKQNFTCDKCGKEYNSNNGLWKHKKKCNNEEATNNDNLIVEKLTYLIVDVVKQNQCIIKQNQELTTKITEVCKYQNNSNNTTIMNNNSNNKTFNLNMFLNETCKDAMNMSEFINSLQIEYDDFEKVGEIGFVNGISNIIIKNLKELDVTQRPLHCTDKKREVMYVKEDNIWQKEDENYTKTRKLIKKTADKNTRLLPEFKKRYPDCGKSSSKYSDKYDLLIIETMGGSGDNDYEKETKILKNIAREVFINKTL
jgi:ribosomal protein L37AE/L43A